MKNYNHKLYGLYDISNNEVCVGIMTMKEVSAYIYMSEENIRRGIKRGTIFRGKYKCEYLDIKENDFEN